ncbi:MAG: HU family DNA-binding protein [Candidatus Thiodiazotropha sp.]
MNKAELIEAMADAADISKAAAGRALDGMVDAITDAMKKGDTLSLVGFGTFSVKARVAGSIPAAPTIWSGSSVG